MFYRLGFWLFKNCAEMPGGDPPPGPFCLLLADGASFLFLSDSTSKLRRP
jgi:hypothetical protein